jgi:flagellar hook-basal body protein
MSLFGAMTSGVSGLTAQSSAMGAIADNITNVNTVGYKNVKTDFQTLVTKQTAVTFYSAGGVQARPLAQNDVQGLLQATSSQTDLGISGQGFFVVNESNRPGLEDQFLFTRAGSFFKDDEGFLRNAAGFYLQGWPTDPDGNVILPPDSGASLTNQNIISTDFLQTVNLNRVGGTATETSRIAMGANLPAGDPVGAQHKVDVQFFDTLGVTKDISFQFTKSSPNAWELNVEPPSGTAVLTLHGDAGDGSDVYASVGQLEFTAQPAHGATLTVAGTLYAFDDGSGGVPGIAVPIGTKLVDTVSALVAAIQGNGAPFDPLDAADHQVRPKAGNETVLLLQGGSGGTLADFTVDFSGLGAAVRQAGSGVTTFTVQQKDVTAPAIQFDARGLPQDFAVKKMAVLDFVNGASDLNNVDLDSDGDVDVTQIALDFGTPHEGNGMTQFGADFTPALHPAERRPLRHLRRRHRRSGRPDDGAVRQRRVAPDLQAPARHLRQSQRPRIAQRQRLDRHRRRPAIRPCGSPTAAPAARSTKRAGSLHRRHRRRVHGHDHGPARLLGRDPHHLHGRRNARGTGPDQALISAFPVLRAVPTSRL